ncbi:MAG: HD domain-containing protein [Desulfobacteraceae bacterium]|nr:MAG: HD domain-containing protein [Desulfobacteraceae bacterium]
MESVQRLVEIIEQIAEGYYSNDIMALTRSDQPEPVRTIAEAMGMMMVKVEAREYNLEMLIDELQALNEKIRKNTIKVVSAMANALAARDRYTEGHTARVGDLAARMAEAMGMSPEEIESVRLGGILHDIGKIGFSDLLFQEHEGRNPPELVKEILRHPSAGAEILRDLDFLGPSVEFVHCHHERPDGKGYPRGLSQDAVPLGARIVAVADTFDAITTDRPYQKGRSAEEALDILKRHAGTKWDAGCVHVLESILGLSQESRGEGSPGTPGRSRPR